MIRLRSSTTTGYDQNKTRGQGVKRGEEVERVERLTKEGDGTNATQRDGETTKHAPTARIVNNNGWEKITNGAVTKQR